MTTNSAGTGLGLALVQQVADGHGWRIRVTESSAGGARFEFHDQPASPDVDSTAGADDNYRSAE